MASVLIFGGDTFIGKAIHDFLKRETNYKIITVISKEQNLFIDDEQNLIIMPFYDKKSIKSLIISIKPEFVVNCTSRDETIFCENNKELAWNLNYGINETILRSCLITDSYFVTFSSEEIFHGNKGPYNVSDIPDPKTYRGKINLAVENLSKTINSKTAVIRYTNVYGINEFDNGIFWLYNMVNKKYSVEVNSNYFSNPVFIDDIAFMTFKLIERKRIGIYNAGGPDYINEYIFANKLAELIGIYDIPINNTFVKGTNDDKLKLGLVNLLTESDLNLKFTDIFSAASAIKYHLKNNNL
jgi:dTDP-4-dehydrorhamnose reductase